MSLHLDHLISKAEHLARSGDNDEAMSLATDLTEQHPSEIKVWMLRAHLWTLKRDYTQAIADLTRAININGMEPSLFYDRGRHALALGDVLSAISDFSEGLRLCDGYNDDYYRGPLHFFRAEALLRLGRKHEALADLHHVREDFTTWTDKLRTKAELLAECSELP